MSASAPAPKKDWSATQYLKFFSQRTRPVHDLLAQIAPLIASPIPRIYDLGCGPGNSTQVLRDAFPAAKITGMDSSADMLTKARASLPDVDFVTGDVSTYQPDKEADLVFSNAVFHWLRHAQRISTLAKLFTGLKSGAVLAIQMPANYHEHSHTQMRVVASLPNRPWSRYFSQTRIGDLADTSRPDLDPVEDPGRYYDALSTHAASVDIWTTNYSHVMEDAGAIVEWVKGTGLQPYLNAMGEDEGVKEAFLGVYEECLREKYPVLVDGKVLLGYPRLFVVAVRK